MKKEYQKYIERIKEVQRKARKENTHFPIILSFKKWQKAKKAEKRLFKGCK